MEANLMPNYINTKVIRAIRRWAVSITIRRSEAGVYDPLTGLPVDGATSNIITEAMVKNILSKDLKFASEGGRVDGMIKIWSEIELITSNSRNSVYSDIVEFNDSDYKVMTVTHHQLGNFYTASAKLIE